MPTRIAPPVTGPDRPLGVTAKHRLLDILLSGAVGCDLITFSTRRREAGVYWRQIAQEITGYTGVDVTETSLRKWYELYGPG